MTEGPTSFAEYSVKKEFVGGYKKRRSILLLLFAISPIVIFPILLMTLGELALYMLLPTIAVLGLCVALPLYRRLCMIEYDYRVQKGEPASGGHLYIAEVYHKSRRKELLSVKVSELEEIAPYRGKYREIADRRRYDKVIDASANPNADETYFAIIPKNDERGSILLFFEPNERMLKILHYLNRKTVIKKA